LTLDPFKGEKGAVFERVLFGDNRFIPFLFRSRGKSDSLAIFVARRKGRTGRVVFRGLRGKRLRHIRLKGFELANERPLVLKSRDGRDRLAFSRRTDQGQVLTEVSLRGKVGRSVVVPVGSFAVILDFDGDGNEEIGVFRNQQGLMLDGREIPLTINGSPVQVTDVRDYTGTEISATPLPIVLSTVVPTVTLTPAVTNAPISTVISTPAGTNTYAASNTSTPTSTFTPSDTPANTPTETNTPTNTPTSTPTATSTNTHTNTATPTTATFGNGEAAINVLGQFSADGNEATPSYTGSCIDNGADFGLNRPFGIAIDTVGHRLFVADTNNYRVLVYSLNNDNTLASKTPVNVLGQPDLRSCSRPASATASNFLDVYYLEMDTTNNRLFVPDYGNSRVLVFDVASISNGESAVNVLGQPNFTSSTSATTQAEMSGPDGVIYDSVNNRLFVADYNNNRVLVYDIASITNGENAVNVLGQPDFTSSTPATTQAGMGKPDALAYDSTTNRLFVDDVTDNKRVLVYDVTSITDGENAVNVLGQANFTSANSACTQNQFTSYSAGLMYSSNFLAVADSSRILFFDVASITNGESAVNVLGQSDFISCTPATSQSRLRTVSDMEYNSSNNQLFVIDSDNHRVLVFDIASITNGENAIDLIGQYTSQSSSGTVTYTRGKLNNGGRESGFNSGSQGPFTALDTVNHRLFVSDTANNRVLVYNLNTDNSFPDRSPDYVIGQPNLTDIPWGSCDYSDEFQSPKGLAFDATNQRLFVADTNCNRIFVFDVSTMANALVATKVLGQTVFNDGTAGVTQSKMNGPTGLAYDEARSYLYVADYNNNRVLVFDVASITDGENAVNRLGQLNYTTATAGATSSQRMNGPWGVAYDSAQKYLAVSDKNNHRVLIFNLLAISNGEAAINVLGQATMTESHTGTTQTNMYSPQGVAFDTTNQRLFVGDQLNSRVLVFDVASITNGENAVNVLGQPNFTSSSYATTQSGLRLPTSIFYSSANQKLFVGDSENNRVMIFE
jgi:DNA-binding beta-propeller fold protein YncE